MRNVLHITQRHTLLRIKSNPFKRLNLPRPTNQLLPPECCSLEASSTHPNSASNACESARLSFQAIPQLPCLFFRDRLNLISGIIRTRFGLKRLTQTHISANGPSTDRSWTQHVVRFYCNFNCARGSVHIVER